MSIFAPTSLTRQIAVSIVVLVVLAAGGFALTRKSVSLPHETAAPSLSEAAVVSHRGESIAGIEISKVLSQPLAEEIHTTGQVLYPADQTVKISPRVQGRVRDVFVKVGDRVAAGQPLALLDSMDAAGAQTVARQSENKLRLAQLTLERTERLYRLGTPEVTSAQAVLDQAVAAVSAATDALDRTKRQAGIGGFAQPPVENAQNAVIVAKGALVQAQSDLAQAQRDRDRKYKLVEIGVAARSDLEQSENVLGKARSAVQSDQESLKVAQHALEREERAFRADLYSDQQIRTAEASLRQATLQESAAKRALTLAKAAILTNLQQARSDYRSAATDVESAQRALSLLGNPGAGGAVRITAPIRGIVTDRQVNPGQNVDQSQMTPWQMFVLSDTDVIWVDADVFEKDVALMKPGQRATIGVNALPGIEFHGTVRKVAPGIDRASRALKARIEIANPGGTLKDGMYASITISAGRSRPVCTVPATAVQHDADADFVWVPEGGKYVRRKIDLGVHFKDRYVVTHGLSAGEAVVSHGAIFLDNQINGGG